MRRFALALFLLPTVASAQVSEAVDALVAPYAELAMFDGVILLARGDTVVHHGAYGLASVEHGVPLAPDARFRVASIAKPVTAAAVSVFIERDSLSLDTTLDAFAPAIPEAERITVRHLLAHRSGVPHLNDLDGYDVVMRGPVGLDSLISWLAAQPLDFEPGTSSTYSNGGYALLAHVLEQVGGKPYGEVIRETVLRPLGMDASAHEELGVLYPGLARGYQPGRTVGERAPAEFVAPDIKIGGGSLVASAPDLLRFARAMDTDDLIPAALADTLLGAGPVRYLSGRAPGYNAVVMRNRPADLTVVVLSNSYAVTANSLAPALLDLLAGGEATLPDMTPSTSAIDWSGAYAWSPPFENTFTLSRGADGWVYAENAGDPTAAVPLADGTLLLPMYDARCTLAEAGGDLTCSAPWTGNALVLTRR